MAAGIARGDVDRRGGTRPSCRRPAQASRNRLSSVQGDCPAATLPELANQSVPPGRVVIGEGRPPAGTRAGNNRAGPSDTWNIAGQAKNNY
jgi:hypothetical protein